MVMEGMEIGLDLSLTEEEEAGLLIPNNDWGQNKEAKNTELTIVGRLLSHRGTNFDALKNMLVSLFQPVKGMILRRITEDRFCIQFNHRLDLQRALDGRSWTFDKNLLIIEPILQGLNPTDISLDWCPFLVYVHDLPLSQHTPAMAKHIGENHVVGNFSSEEHSAGSATRVSEASPIPPTPQPDTTSHVLTSNLNLIDVPLTTSDPFNLGPLITKSKPKRTVYSKRQKQKGLPIQTTAKLGKRKLPPSFFLHESFDIRLGKKSAILDSSCMEEDISSAETASQSRRGL
ncbi:UNVERIFIED_CONTAM: hypothetical protein Sangu_2608100 [Sesamum angustifolium]|uniref:DUF4283 domain-containing protein n=1 Tax=Sesamum angustifolium TaxID=2727405 RepID=A0AAW2J5F0_9LAMI